MSRRRRYSKQLWAIVRIDEGQVLTDSAQAIALSLEMAVTVKEVVEDMTLAGREVDRLNALRPVSSRYFRVATRLLEGTNE